MVAGRMGQVFSQVDAISSQYKPYVPQEINGTSRCRIRAQNFREAPTIRHTQELLFKSLWHLGIPIVIYGVHDRMQGSWTPELLAKTHGNQIVTMLKSGGLPSARVTLTHFFHEFAKTDNERGYAVKLKVSRLRMTRVLV